MIGPKTYSNDALIYTVKLLITTSGLHFHELSTPEKLLFIRPSCWVLYRHVYVYLVRMRSSHVWRQISRHSETRGGSFHGI